MEVKTLMPVTIAERMEMGEELRIPASFDEFLDLLEKCEYNIEYDRGKTISFLGYGTLNHEKIIGRLMGQIGSLLNDDKYSLYGGRLPLFIPINRKAYYNADFTIVRGIEKEVALNDKIIAISNPVLLIEVLSEPKCNFDLGGKLLSYITIPSLQQLLYFKSKEMSVWSYTKYNEAGEWLLKIYEKPEDKIKILDEGHIAMSDVYKNINL